MKNYKLIAAIVLLLIILAGGWYMFTTDDYTDEDYEPTTSESTTDEPAQDAMTVTNEWLSLTFTYADNAFTYSGMVRKPTPCHQLETDVNIMESFPEQVKLNIDVIPTEDPCITVVDEEEVFGEIAVSENAIIQVALNGEVIDTINEE